MNAPRPSIRRTRSGRLAAGVAVAGLLARALIPLGYMPGNLLAGEFMVLCPSGLTGQIAESLHHHHGESETVFDADRACPIGAALQYAGIPTDVVEANVSAGFQEAPLAEPRVLRGLKPLRLFHARAPPAVRI